MKIQLSSRIRYFIVQIIRSLILTAFLCVSRDTHTCVINPTHTQKDNWSQYKSRLCFPFYFFSFYFRIVCNKNPQQQQQHKTSCLLDIQSFLSPSSFCSHTFSVSWPKVSGATKVTLKKGPETLEQHDTTPPQTCFVHDYIWSPPNVFSDSFSFLSFV